MSTEVTPEGTVKIPLLVKVVVGMSNKEKQALSLNVSRFLKILNPNSAYGYADYDQ
jgi:hypothetical protein